MPVSDYADPNATATRLVWRTGDPPTYDPPVGATAHPVAAVPAAGSEKVSIGKDISQKIYKVFCDFVGGAPPFEVEDRMRLEGMPDAGDYDILSVQPYEFGEDVAIIMAEKYT